MNQLQLSSSLKLMTNSDLIKQQLFANCRSIADFERLDKLGEGTYGTVYGAKDKQSSQVVAIKKVKIHDTDEGFPITCLREIRILQQLCAHPNIVNLKVNLINLEVAVGPLKDSIHLVFEYCTIDLATLIDKMYIVFLYKSLKLENYVFKENEIKCITLQILNGLSFIHQNFIIHRDLKLGNLLLNQDGIIKIADFGLAREYEIPYKRYTNPVVTLWYRAPELLIGQHNYSASIDIWSMGLIFAELLNRGIPLLQGKSEIHQIQLICELLGFPSMEEWQGLCQNGNKAILKEMEKFQHYKGKNLHRMMPQASKQAIELIYKMLQWDPKKRIAVTETLQHPYFYESPRPSMPEEIKILKKLEAFRKKNYEHGEKKIKK